MTNIVTDAAAMLQEAGHNPGDDAYESLLAATIQALAVQRAAETNRLGQLERGRMLKEGLEKVASELRTANSRPWGRTENGFQER